MKNIQEILKSAVSQPGSYEKVQVLNSSQLYSIHKHIPSIITKICEYLLLIDPLWSMGAATVIYLSIFQIISWDSWTGLIAGILPFLARLVNRGYISLRTPFDLPIGLLLIAGLIGICVSSNKDLSWSVYQTLIISIMFYYSFVNYERPYLLIKVSLLIAAIALIVLVPYVWLQKPTSLPFFSQLQSWLFPNPESLPSKGDPLFASACGVTVTAEIVTVILAGIAVYPSQKTTRIVAGILTFLLLGVLVISGCHATWIIMTCGMLIVLVCRSKWLIFSLPAWFGIIYYSLTTWKGLDLGQAIDIVYGNLQSRWDGRWEGILSMLADHPVTGLGLGIYPAIYTEYGINGPHAHNAYLQFLSDFGLLGLVALVIATIIFINLVFKIRNNYCSNPWPGIVIGAFAAIIVGAAYSLIESSPACIFATGTDSYYHYAISPLFIILCAVLVVAYRSPIYQISNIEKIEGNLNIV